MPRHRRTGETIERRCGNQIAASGISRDPVRSSRSHIVKTSGLRWMCMMLLAPIPWAYRTTPLRAAGAGAHRSRRGGVADQRMGCGALAGRPVPEKTLGVPGRRDATALVGSRDFPYHPAGAEHILAGDVAGTSVPPGYGDAHPNGSVVWKQMPADLFGYAGLRTLAVLSSCLFCSVAETR